MPRSLVFSYILTMACAVVMGCVGLALATLMPTQLSLSNYLAVLSLVTIALLMTMLAPDIRVKLASAFFMIGAFSAGHMLTAFFAFGLIALIGIRAASNSPLRQQLAMATAH